MIDEIAIRREAYGAGGDKRASSYPASIAVRRDAGQLQHGRYDVILRG
jgi:hypothetical protein